MHLPLAHYKAIFHSTASKIHEISWSTEKFDLFLQTLWRGTMAINVVEEFSTTRFELQILSLGLRYEELLVASLRQRGVSWNKKFSFYQKKKQANLRPNLAVPICIT